MLDIDLIQILNQQVEKLQLKNKTEKEKEKIFNGPIESTNKS